MSIIQIRIYLFILFLDSRNKLILKFFVKFKGANSRTSFEEYDWETTEANANEENANQKYTYDIDESPGLYGEVADYWKSYEDNDITDRNETYINDTYNNSTVIFSTQCIVYKFIV